MIIFFYMQQVTFLVIEFLREQEIFGIWKEANNK